MSERPTQETDAFSGYIGDWIKFAEKLERERDEARAALRVIADCQNWFHTDKEEGGPYTAWRGDGQPDEIAEKALEEAK